MAVKRVDNGLAPGHPGKTAVTAIVRTEATILVSRLSFDSLLGHARTIGELKEVRIDRQPPPAGGANIQIQLNGISGDTSIATCVIAPSVLSSLTDWPEGLQDHQRRWLTRQVRIALTAGLDTLLIYHIVGSFHDPDNALSLTPRKHDRYKNRRGGPVQVSP